MQFGEAQVESAVVWAVIGEGGTCIKRHATAGYLMTRDSQMILGVI